MPDRQLREWGPEAASRLAELCEGAMATEALSADELATVCWEDPTRPVANVVLATADGEAAVAAVVRETDGHVAGYVRMVVVSPELQRRGVGGELLDAAEVWLRDHRAEVVSLAGDAPVYLWPGVDASWIGAMCLAESRRYRVTGARLNMSLPASFRRDPPDGIEIRRLVDTGDVEAMRDLVAARWPFWLVEFDLAVPSATVFGAFGPDGEPVGFCAHSVLRFGWLGPMATSAELRGRGLGQALVSAVCEDISVAGARSVEIASVGPVRFYAKLGASVSRVFRSYGKRLS